MINLCFSESTKGSLKYAFRSRGEQVACLPFLLFWGDIKDVLNIESRKSVYEMMGPEYVEMVKLSLWEFKMLTEKDKEVRIWYSSAETGELCGLLHAVTMLTDHTLTAVDCYREVRSGHTVTYYRNTAELDEEALVEFLQYEYAPEAEKLQEWREHFIRLQEENTPLRVIEKEQLISVDISYFDRFIGQYLGTGEKSIARIIGAVIGHREDCGMPCSDTFIAGRLQSFLDRGIIKLVTRKDHFYKSTVKLVGDINLI